MRRHEEPQLLSTKSPSLQPLRHAVHGVGEARPLVVVRTCTRGVAFPRIASVPSTSDETELRIGCEKTRPSSAAEHESHRPIAPSADRWCGAAPARDRWPKQQHAEPLPIRSGDRMRERQRAKWRSRWRDRAPAGRPRRGALRISARWRPIADRLTRGVKRRRRDRSSAKKLDGIGGQRLAQA